jgi:hypothetical protein
VNVSGLFRLRQPTIDRGIPGDYLVAVHEQRFFQGGLESIAHVILCGIGCIDGAHGDTRSCRDGDIRRCLYAGMLYRLGSLGSELVDAFGWSLAAHSESNLS